MKWTPTSYNDLHCLACDTRSDLQQEKVMGIWPLTSSVVIQHTIFHSPTMGTIYTVILPF